MPFGLPDRSIALLHDILRQYPGIEKAIVYGSRAKGTYKAGSDIDLTLVGDSLTTRDQWRIASALDDSPLPYMVDISLLHQITNPQLRAHIERVGVAFYERDEPKPEINHLEN
ncbi:MAG: nucleotidyltransferase domain-containing protein [Holosporales bacterium]